MGWAAACRVGAEVPRPNRRSIRILACTIGRVALNTVEFSMVRKCAARFSNSICCRWQAWSNSCRCAISSCLLMESSVFVSWAWVSKALVRSSCESASCKRTWSSLSCAVAS